MTKKPKCVIIIKMTNVESVFLTVFTPTYNRGYILHKLYESLQAQTDFNFEWLIIDDGSTDNTEELILNWKKEQNNFTIKYIKQTNSGKCSSINRGVSVASGKMFFIVDSDDYLTSDAVKKIIQSEKKIPQNKKFAGLCKNRCDQYGVSNPSFVGKTLDITMLDRAKYDIYGDKAEVFYTDVLKKYPFPVFEGENFGILALVWNRIANDGWKLRFDQDAIYVCEYLEDGLTKNYKKNLKNNPKGTKLFYKELITLSSVSFFYKLHAINLYTQWVYNDKNYVQVAKDLNCSLFLVVLAVVKEKLFHKEKHSYCTFLINLDKDEDRYSFMSEHLQSIGLSFEKISAVNGLEYLEKNNVELYNQEKAVANLKLYGRQEMTPGELGCALSHRYCYQKFLTDPKYKNTEYLLILEDDVILDKNFKKYLLKVINRNGIHHQDFNYLQFYYELVSKNYIKENAKKYYKLQWKTYKNQVTFFKKIKHLPVLLFQPLYKLFFNVMFYLVRYRKGIIKVPGRVPAGTVAYLIDRTAAEKMLVITDKIEYLADLATNICYKKNKNKLRFCLYSPRITKLNNSFISSIDLMKERKK